MVPENVCDLLWVVFVVLPPLSTPVIWKFLLCTWNPLLVDINPSVFLFKALGVVLLNFLPLYYSIKLYYDAVLSKPFNKYIFSAQNY